MLRIDSRLGATLVLLLLVSAGLLACAVQWSESDTPVHLWWKQRGPVVPHDSFPADCSLCHMGSDWKSIREDFAFDHLAETGFELEGAHAKAECLRCHNDRGPVQQFAEAGCTGCHEDVHLGQLGTNCEDCHATRDWSPRGEIANHNRTRFPLVGAHSSVACWRCHVGAEVGNFRGASTRCEVCHADDLAAAVNPNHQAAGFTTDCQLCHLPTTWSGGGFVHPGFALTGAHNTDNCSACHVGGSFAGLSNDCFSCHAADYAAATDPNHMALGISTQCQLCHGTSTWQGAQFSHLGITSGCVECHLPDYNATTDPNHANAGFPTSCESCHNTNTWSGAVFNHSFPINSGAHKNFDCADCHTTPGNTSAFSCTHCHDHNQSKMNNDHDEVSGYTWSSPACYSCHPNGKS